MSQDIENKEKTEIGFSNGGPKKVNQWLPLIINGGIFVIYSLIILASALIDKNEEYYSGPIGWYASLIFLQVILNFLTFLVLCFINFKQAALFLLSAVMVLLIGFSVCGGIGNLASNKNRNKSEFARKAVIDSLNRATKADSIIQAKRTDSVQLK